MFYYQFNIGDYASHTRHLSIYEDIAYRRLLDWYYLNEKPIPSSPQDAARLIGMKDRYPDVECVLEEFFTLSDEGWINKRADKEISVYKGFSDAGKRGAAKRWSKGSDSPPIAPFIANTNQEPITNNQETVNNKKPISSPKGSRYPQDSILSAKWGNIALELRPDFDNDDVRLEFDAFKDYWCAKPGKDGVKLDWLATWRNWCRNSKRVGNAKNE